jgi:outer membrane protein OmpA-like peptidoglycan-associated protein/tetratricopeptide (TPR) repeat protein
VKAFYFIIIISLIITAASAQQGVSTKSFRIVPLEECQGSQEKKVIKYLEEAADRKNSKEERIEALRKVIEEDPDCAEAHYMLGLELLRSAISRGASFKKAESELREVVRICPDFHFEPYYYLGSIALGRKAYGEAIEYYDKYYKLSASSADPLDDEREDALKLDYEYAKFFKDVYDKPVPFEPSRVKGVCTDDDEFLPLISPDNEKMLLTRRYTIESQVKASLMSEKEQFTEKFVQAKRLQGEDFEEGEPFPTPFNENESFRYGGATMTIDNKHVYLTICKPASMGYVNCDIYTATLKYGRDPKTGMTGYYWSELENLGLNVNTENGFESQPSISADGQTLYFTSDRGDNAGLEIYFSKKDENGNWKMAENIGPPINTPYNDKTPFMHSDSRTLYFASDGHLGLGGLDVFYTKQKYDGSWEKPVNLGYPINSELDEQAFAVSTDGKLVYYSAKDRTNPQSIDIWSFELYKEARPDKVVFVKGKLTNEEGDPAQNAKVELKSMDSRKITKVDVNNDDGSYAAVIAVKEQEAVVMNVKGDDIAFQSKLIDTEPKGEKKQRTNAEEVDAFQEIDFDVAEVKAGGVYKINDIYYRSNSSEISEKSKYILTEFAEYLKENKKMRIAIHGHTDNVGKAEDNRALSSDRAFSVKQYIESLGVSGDRIEYQGFGETVPFASNDTEEGRAANRRTEFLILEK